MELDSDSTRFDGLVSEDNQIMGTYLHGLFDKPSAANALLAWAGLKSQEAANLDDIREQQLEPLADALEESLSSSFINTLKQA